MCLIHLQGLTATVTLNNGEVFSGIFFGASMDNDESAYMLKMVQQIKSVEKKELNGARDNKDNFVGIGQDHSVSFDFKDVSNISVEGVGLGAQDKYENGILVLLQSKQATDNDSGAASGFCTDTDISGNLGLRERQLQRWTSAADNDIDLSLEESGTGGAWDQFKANEQLFGLKSDYDENIYTTRIDRTKPSYREHEAAAARIAEEIEGTLTSNAHVREERGMIDEDGDLDEEEK